VIIARQRYDKHVSAAIDSDATIEDAVFLYGPRQGYMTGPEPTRPDPVIVRKGAISESVPAPVTARRGGVTSSSQTAPLFAVEAPYQNT
jgi:hypothetical protein